MSKKDPELYLSPREIKNFVHNAQLAVCELISDDRIPAVYYYKTHLLTLLKDSKFSKEELAAVLISVAYDLLTGGGDGKSGSGSQAE